MYSIILRTWIKTKLEPIYNTVGRIWWDNHYYHSNIEQISLPEDPHCILTQVAHVDQEVSPFFILVLYTPASSSRERISFFNSLLDFAQISPYSDQSCIQRLIIADNFNYDAFNIVLCASSPRNGLRQWNHFLRCQFSNVMSDLPQLNAPTFYRRDTTSLTIDFIFLSFLSSSFANADVEYI